MWEKSKFIVTLRGKAIFNGCLLFCFIEDTTEETLNKVALALKKSYYNLDVDFSTKHTSNKDIDVYIEEVYPIE